MKKKQPKYVYLISSATYGASIYFKVGVTCNLFNRSRQIGLNCPFPVTVIIAVEDDDPLSLEGMVLSEFQKYRMKGEWFCITPDIDGSTCTYRQYCQALSKKAKEVESEMISYIKERCTGGSVNV